MNSCPTEAAGKPNQSTTLGNADQVVVRISPKRRNPGNRSMSGRSFSWRLSAVLFSLRSPVKFLLAAAAGED
jgi:hypothetical protein